MKGNRRIDPVLKTEFLSTVNQCVRQNSIVRLPGNCCGTIKFELAIHIVTRCLDGSNTKEVALILAPTVSLIRQAFEIAKTFRSLNVRYVIGDAGVDNWERGKWQAVFDQNELILATPGLFLEAVDAAKLQLDCFCVVLFLECQHCVGSHPMSRLLTEHYSLVRPTGSVRIVGFGQICLKRKVRDEQEHHT